MVRIPTDHSDSAGNAVCAAKTPEMRALLKTHGGTLDPFDLVWLDEDDEVMRFVKEGPKSAELACGGRFYRSGRPPETRPVEAIATQAFACPLPHARTVLATATKDVGESNP